MAEVPTERQKTKRFKKKSRFLQYTPEIICTEQGHELKDHSFQRTASRNVLELMQIPLLKSFPNAIKTLFWILYSWILIQLLL